MYQNKLKIKNLSVFFIIFIIFTPSFAEIMILSGCKSLNDSFIKNEYILDIEKSIMIRNYIYDSKTFKKFSTTDLSIKKENRLEKFIYEEGDSILTDKIGYPQFYTQLVFKKNKLVVNIKTVINNEESFSKISTCSKVEIFERES